MLLVAFLSLFLSLASFLPAPARAQLLVDDADRKVRYGPLEFRSCAQPADCFGAWFVDARAMNSGSTLHLTGGPGTFLDFDFIGTNISVFGALLPNGADALFSLDGGQPTRVPTHSAATRFQTQLFASAALPSGAHTLHVEFAGTPASELLGVDYFVVGSSQSSGPDPAPAPVPAPPDSSATSPATTAEATSSSAASPDPSSSAQSMPSGGSQFSPAAAAAIGFVCAAAAIVLVLVLWMCRRRRTAPRNGTGTRPLVSFWDFTTTQRQTQMAQQQEQGQIVSAASARAPSSPTRASVARWASSVHAASVSASSPRIVAYSTPSPTRYHPYQRSNNGDVFIE